MGGATSEGGGGGRRVSGSSIARMTYFSWLETKVGTQHALTAGDDGKPVENVSTEEHIRRCLEIPDAILMGDLRPTLVYFHWPHDQTANGKLSDTLCDKTLADEMAARWGMLFRCVQIDMATSDKRLLEILEAGDHPSFVVVDKDAKVIAHIPALPSATKFAKALEDAALKIDDVAKLVKESIAEQAKAMADAKLLLKADKLQEALDKVNVVRYAKVRVGPLFDKAQQDGEDINGRIDRARMKNAR
jgi:predicted RNase H-like HicB family nuclease